MSIVQDIIEWYYRRKNRQTYDYLNFLLSLAIQIEVLGKRKRGKTMLLILFALAYHSNPQYKISQDYAIDELRALFGVGPDVLKKSDTAVWGNIDVVLDKHRGIKNNFMNFSEFGIPNDVRKVRNVPPNSLLIYDEVQGEASSANKTWTDDQLLGVQFAGHNDYKFILASQRLGDVSAKVKELSDLFILIRDKAKIITNKKGICKRVILKIAIYSEKEDAERRVKPKKFKRDEVLDRICKTKTIKWYGNIFEHYNPKLLRLIWYVNLDKTGYQPYKLPDLSIPDKPTIKTFERVFRCFSTKAYKEAQQKRWDIEDGVVETKEKATKKV